MSLVNNTRTLAHTLCIQGPGLFLGAELFCDMPANESQAVLLSFSTMVGITSFCSSLILLLPCSSWIVSLWCSSCRTLSRFSMSACVFSRVLTVLLRLVVCFLELRQNAGSDCRSITSLHHKSAKGYFSNSKMKCKAGY